MRRRRNSQRRRSKKSEAVSESEQHFRWLVPSSALIHRHGIEFLRRARDALWQKHEDETKRNTNTKKIVEQGKIVGSIPGMEVGFQFFSRGEMVAAGMHSNWLSSVDYIPKKKGSAVIRSYSLPLTVAIVLCGNGDDDGDDDDDPEEIVFKGLAADGLFATKFQIQDQFMTDANLALKNSIKHATPVRVIRGHKCANSYTEKVYTFDGLYQVVDYWKEKGASGFNVFKFRLKRSPGQPSLLPNKVRSSLASSSSARSEILGLVSEDISNGKESIQIPVTNVVDDAHLPPEGFTYITSIEISSSIKIPANARGCKCKDRCTDPEACSCAKLNCSGFPYVIQNGGRLIEPKDVVFECGPNCGCGSDCINRVSQQGLKYRLEVYRTLDKGWGVRSWDYIPSGAPVCEYIGVLRKSDEDELETATENEFIFEIDCLQTINGIGSRERRSGDVSLPRKRHCAVNRSAESGPEYCIDAVSKGNITRFINHSCEPNLFVQCVTSSHRDLRLARIVLFAADNIVPLQELTYDYGYELDSVVGSDGKIKKLACFCGATCCRRRLY